MAEPGPVGHVVVVHRGAPAEDVVADEETRQHADGDGDQGDAGKGRKLAHRIAADVDWPRLRKRRLDQS